jgi:hypothetical protein
MRHLLRTSSIIAALLNAVVCAAAQQSPSTAPPMDAPPPSDSSQQALALNPAQRLAIVRDVRGEETQISAQGERAQVGSKATDSASLRPLPDQATSDVPQTKKLLFVKLPDRILLIDPDQQMVAEIIPTGNVGDRGTDTGGLNTNSPASSRD